MPSGRQRYGKLNENLAVNYLKRQGCRIVERNFRTARGEIDIIARDGDTLVFVEVKARRSRSRGSPKEAVTPEKQRRISLAALQYLKTAPSPLNRARFDVVAILTEAGPAQIEWIRNAFELAC
jgi:putative endonuclease